MNRSLERRAAVNGHAACSAETPFEAIAIEGVDMEIGVNDASAHFDHTALAEVISRRWREDRPFFTLDGETWGARLEASWWPVEHRKLCLALTFCFGGETSRKSLTG